VASLPATSSGALRYGLGSERAGGEPSRRGWPTARAQGRFRPTRLLAWLSRAAGAAGDTSSVANAWQRSRNGHSKHRGRRERQTRAPRSIRASPKSAAFRCGSSSSTSDHCAGSSRGRARVERSPKTRPRRRITFGSRSGRRWLYASASTAFATYSPTPGSASRAAFDRGTLPRCWAQRARPSAGKRALR
jgi:hypothetical protein